MNTRAFLRVALVTSLILPTVYGASLEPETMAERTAAAGACVVADLVFQHSEPLNGQVYTRFVFRSVETLKGTVPAYFEAHAPGGEWNGIMNVDSRRPQLPSGGRYLLFLQVEQDILRFRDGFVGAVPVASVDLPAVRDLCASQTGGIDLSAFAQEPISVSASVTASGLLETDGVRRFTLGDQNRSIPVIADVSTRPNSITETQALTALQNAMDAWEAVSTLQFELVGTETFSQSANTYTSSDGLVIRVQFHDTFNAISNASSTLGFGGARFSLNPGGGGTVDGTPFNPITYGYIILDHPKETLEDPVALEEVLTHELGHVIGLAHSSETNPEADAVKREAMMYYQAHDDGRGADLRSWDTTTVVQAYPANTPPYSFDQKFNAVTIPDGSTLANPEVNQVVMEGWDLNGDSLTFVVDSASTTNGSFSTSGSTVTFTPSGYFGDGSVGNPNQSFYDRLIGHFSDGVNESPTVEVWIIGFRGDSWPAGSPDGIPDAWMTTYYGSISGSTAGADTDVDTFSTLQEYRMGTNPTDPDSRLELTGIGNGSLEWICRRFDLYRIQTRTDLLSGDWTTIRLSTQSADASTLTIDELPTAEAGGSPLFFRIQRVE